jgi:hypothetical protein
MSAIAHSGAAGRSSSCRLAIRLLAELLVGGLVLCSLIEAVIGVLVARGLNGAVTSSAVAAARAPASSRTAVALTQLTDSISPQTHGQVAPPCDSPALQCSVSEPHPCPASLQGSSCVTVSVSYDYDQARHVVPDVLGVYPTFHATHTVVVNGG